MSFFPNTTGVRSVRTGYDRDGDPVFGGNQVLPCSIVKLNLSVAKTALRESQSASKGNSEEDVDVATILFPMNVSLSTGDRFKIANFVLRFKSIMPMFNTAGQQDHWQCGFDAWTDDEASS